MSLSTYVSVALFLFITVFVFRCSTNDVTDVGQCPTLCTCDIWLDLRRVLCVARHIASIEADVPSQTQALDLSDNIIYTLPDHGFTELRLNSLQFLNLSGNHIGYISLRAFEGLLELRYLDLSNNNLQELIPTLFGTNTNLKRLYLSGNKFATINPVPFLESNSLEVLDISHCLISYLHSEMFSKLPLLTLLNLSDNLLMEMTVAVFKNLPALKTLILLKNQLTCDNFDVKAVAIFCLKNAVTYESPCQVVEKLQKIIMQTDQTKTTLIPSRDNTEISWKSEDFDTNLLERQHPTMINLIPTVSYVNECLSLIPLLVSFSVGILVGVMNVCFCVIIVICSKKWKAERKKIYRDGNSFLLEEQVDLGMSTPITHRRSSFKR